MPVNTQLTLLGPELSIVNGQICVASTFDGNGLEHDPVEWSSWLTREALNGSLIFRIECR
jgi:hypothetical protein